MRRCWSAGIPSLFWIISFKSKIVSLGLVSKLIVFSVRVFTKICMPEVGTKYSTDSVGMLYSHKGRPFSSLLPSNRRYCLSTGNPNFLSIFTWTLWTLTLGSVSTVIVLPANVFTKRSLLPGRRTRRLELTWKLLVIWPLTFSLKGSPNVFSACVSFKVTAVSSLPTSCLPPVYFAEGGSLWAIVVFGNDHCWASDDFCSRFLCEVLIWCLGVCGGSELSSSFLFSGRNRTTSVNFYQDEGWKGMSAIERWFILKVFLRKGSPVLWRNCIQPIR